MSFFFLFSCAEKGISYTTLWKVIICCQTMMMITSSVIVMLVFAREVMIKAIMATTVHCGHEKAK